MERKPGIYMIRNCVNGKIYIGKSIDMHKRKINHINELRRGDHKNIYLQRAFNKYGEDSFLFSVVEYCDADKLDEREIYWINKLGSFGGGYNLTCGGEGNTGYVMSEESRKRMSDRMRGVFSGDKNPMFGKSWRNYTSQETIERHDRTIQRKLKENPPNSSPVVCLNTGEHFKTILEASEKLGVKYFRVMYCCSGKMKNCNTKIMDKKVVCVYEKDFQNMSDAEKRARLAVGQTERLRKDSPRAKKIVNLTIGELFDTVTDASEAYKISQSGVSSCLTDRVLSSGKTHDGNPCVWVYLPEYLGMREEDIRNRVEKAKNANKGENKPNARAVVCLTTGDIFSNATEAAKSFHIDTSSLVKCCKGKQASCGKLNGEKLTWQYVS